MCQVGVVKEAFKFRSDTVAYVIKFYLYTHSTGESEGNLMYSAGIGDGDVSNCCATKFIAHCSEFATNAKFNNLRFSPRAILLATIEICIE